MTSVLYGAGDVAKAFAAREVGTEFDDTAHGLVIVRDGVLIGSVVFHNFKGFDVQVTCAAADPRWARRGILAELFAVPFRQWGCARMTAITGKTNMRTQRFLAGIGFMREGEHALGLDGHEDAVTFGMTRANCRWLKD